MARATEQLNATTEQLIATANLNEELKATVKDLNETVETLNAEHEVRIRELNETNEELAAEIEKINGK